LNVLLHDFAAELVKRRVLSRAQLVGLMELSRARVEKSSNRQTQDADTTVQVPDVTRGTEPLVSNEKNSTTRIPHLRGAFHET
jgi:hypothetical protein